MNKNVIIGVLIIAVIILGVILLMSDGSMVENPVASYSPSPTGSTPSISQSEAESLVYTKWSDCSQGDCGSVKVTVDQDSNGQYAVTAIFTELDDSTSQTKYVSTAIYQNGRWTLEETSLTRACHRGHVDGSQGFSSALCI